MRKETFTEIRLRERAERKRHNRERYERRYYRIAEQRMRKMFPMRWSTVKIPLKPFIITSDAIAKLDKHHFTSGAATNG